jgi:hypothetical protein
MVIICQADVLRKLEVIIIPNVFKLKEGEG